jgi:hypothetical protein
MTTIQPQQQPAFWQIDGGNGLTLVGELTGVQIGLPVAWGEGEADYLAALQSTQIALTPLPEPGEWLEQGAAYSWDSQVVVVRQSHWRTHHSPPDVPALFMFWQPEGDGVPNWIVGEQVFVGTRRRYDDVVYEAIQAHVTQSDWTPPVVPALWAIVAPPSVEWQPYVEYTIGDEVTYNGVLYRCRQSHTSLPGWEPPNVLSLWLPI